MDSKFLPLPKINNNFYKIYSYIITLVFVVCLIVFFQGIFNGWLKIERKDKIETTPTTLLSLKDFEKLKQSLIEEYKDKVPRQWGENLKGVKTRLVTDKKVLALTFDATGIETGKGYDEELINYLIENKIPATLFLSGLWIDKNPEILKELSKVEFFEIANLGANHLPCSLNGKEVYGIKGTRNVEEIISEIEDNALKIAEYTGKKPKYYRAGTVYTDEYCPEIAEKLGYEIVGFSVLGDAGATYSKEKVKNALLNAQPGDIVILHMNIPKSETYEGLKEAIPLLKEKGFEFVKLSDYPLQ